MARRLRNDGHFTCKRLWLISGSATGQPGAELPRAGCAWPGEGSMERGGTSAKLLNKTNMGLTLYSQKPGTNRDFMTLTVAGEERRQGQYLVGQPPYQQPFFDRHRPPPDTYPDSVAPHRSRQSSHGARCTVCSCECTAPCPGSCAHWVGIETPCSEDLQDSKRQNCHQRESMTALQPHHPEETPKISRKPSAPPHCSAMALQQ